MEMLPNIGGLHYYIHNYERMSYFSVHGSAPKQRKFVWGILLNKMGSYHL